MNTPSPVEDVDSDTFLAYLKARDAGEPADPGAWPALAPLLGAEAALFGTAGLDCPAAPLPRAFGAYELVEELARGGMGVVYRAWQPAVGRFVALKVIRSGEFASGAEVRRFELEAAAAGRLDHPNIVPVFEAGVVGDTRYFTMPLVRGESLAAHVTRLSRDHRAAAALVATVARAVHHAHRHGVLHRDIKPGNILIDPEGVPHVTDFGLAKLSAEGGGTATGSGLAVGTPAYMAPEQATGDAPPTTATDVYGLGVTLYQLLTGRTPFGGESPIRVLREVAEREPPAPHLFNGQVDRDLETVCLKCLEKDPRRRYDSAAALADDLDRWAAGEPVRARRVGRAERLAKWARRNPAVAASAALALLAAVGGFTGVLWQWRAAEGHAAEARAANHDLTAAVEERRQAQAELEWAVYATSIALADREASAGNTGQADAVLERCPAHLRGWEWHHLRRRARDQGPRRLDGHERVVRALAFSPAGATLAAGCGDGRVFLWDPATGRERGRLRPPEGSVTGLAFDATGARLAVSNWNGFAEVWHPASGARLARLERDGPAVSAAFARDGRVSLGVNGGPGRPGGLFGWHPGSGTAETLVPAESLSQAVCPDTGATAVLVSPDTLRVRDAAGRELWSAPCGGVRPGPVAFRPGGDALVSAVGTSRAEAAGSRVTAWDAATGRALHSAVLHSGEVRALAWTADGRRIITASEDTTAVVRDPDTFRPLLTLRGHADAVDALAVSPDGRYVATGGGDRTALVWDGGPGADADAAPADVFVPPLERPSSVALSGDGARVALADADGRRVAVWDRRTRKRLAEVALPAGRVVRTALDRAGATLAVADDDFVVRAWRIADGSVVRALEPDAPRRGSFCRGLALSPDGRWLGVSSGSHARYEPADGTPSAWSADAYLTLAALSPDGEHVAAADDRHAVHLRRRADGATVRRLGTHAGEVCAFAFSADSTRLASAGADRVVRVWGLVGGGVLALSGHSDIVRDAAFSPDGTRVAAGGADRTVRVWDARTGVPVATFRGHTGTVWRVAFSADGREVVAATTGDRPEVRAWRLP